MQWQNTFAMNFFDFLWFKNYSKRNLCYIGFTMEFDIHFDKNQQSFYILPGYHVVWRKRIGETITTQNGLHAVISNVELQRNWRQLSPVEKKWLKERHGSNAKAKFHQFTIIRFVRNLPTQPLFPSIDWSQPDFEVTYIA